jgi:hypothetical protein
LSLLQKKDRKNDKNKDDVLEPLSKEEALASIRKFREDFHLTEIHADKKDIQNILKKAGSLSDEVTKMRHEHDV